MALSQDEQRMLAEIERRLVADDPGLASCLTTFRRPSPASVLRSPRARIIGSLFTVLLVAMVSLMVYAMIPFRTHMPRHPQATSSAQVSTPVSATASGQPDHSQLSPASGSAEASGSADASAQSSTGQSRASRTTAAAATATGKSQGAKAQPTPVEMLPVTSTP
jgi:cytoskeletal protein RodZ